MICGLLEYRKKGFGLGNAFSILKFDKISTLGFEAVSLHILLAWTDTVQPFITL